MTLRKKTLGVITLTLIALIGALYFAASTILIGGFEEAEQRDMQRNVLRVQEALSNELSQLNISAKDYALADVSLEVLADLLDQHATRVTAEGKNALADLLADLQINVLLFTDYASGEIVWSRGFNEEDEEVGPLPEGLHQHLGPDSPLLRHPEDAPGLTGIILLPDGPMLIVSEYVLASQRDAPIIGATIMGRYLDASEIQDIADQTRLSLAVRQFNDIRMPADFLSARLPLLEAAPTLVRPLSRDSIAGYTFLQDIYGDPALLIRVDVPRDILAEGRRSTRYLLLSLLLIGVILVGVILLLLDKFVLSRLARLTREITGIRTTSDLSARVFARGTDELSSLGSSVNGMLEGLEEAHNRDQAYLSAIEAEKERAEGLLLNILPAPIAERLKQGENIIADAYTQVTVLFGDIVGFTAYSARMPAELLVGSLNKLFSAFDRLSQRHNLEKIKTIGDAYMVVGGLPIPRVDHAAAIADMALEMREEVTRFNAESGLGFSIRIGINSGPAVAGVIGEIKFIYDLWGDTVNTAARMESEGVPDRIQVGPSTYEQLRDQYAFEDRGVISVKGKGDVHTYFLNGKLLPVE